MNTELTANKLTEWIKEKVVAVGGRGVVLGMSGGIDSSVLAVLCQRAFPTTTLGAIIPCYSTSEDAVHAHLVAAKFSIPTRTVAIDGIYDALLKILPPEVANTRLNQLAKTNLKPRLRMLVLYYLANQLNYLVAGSSNRSELAVGYFTKYGDGGVDIIPLGNLVKSEIRELASFLGIPKVIIDKPPTAGLWAGQTDEAEMGLTYADLDRYLLTGEASPQIKEKIDSMNASSNHKRVLPPVAEIEQPS